MDKTVQKNTEVPENVRPISYQPMSLVLVSFWLFWGSFGCIIELTVGQKDIIDGRVSFVKNIIDFLKTHVNGKTVHTKELIYELEGGTLHGVYSDQMSFSNLKYSQSGLQFDMFIISNEKIYCMGKDGKREGLRKDVSAVSLFRFELAKRKSTGAVTGLFRCISASGKEMPAEAIVSGIYDVHIDGDTLKLKEEQALYRDQPIRDNQFKSVAFVSEHRFFKRDSKLHYEYDGRSFDVDGITLHRKTSEDMFPPFISIEK